MTLNQKGENKIGPYTLMGIVVGGAVGGAGGVVLGGLLGLLIDNNK